MKGPVSLPLSVIGEGVSATAKKADEAASPQVDDRRARVQSLRSSLGNLAWQMVPATELPQRVEPEVLATGVRALDEAIRGLPRGGMTEIYGPASSGRTSVLLAALASATRRGEVCALVDTTDSFDPLSGEAAGIDLGQLLWVRCNGAQPPKEKTARRFAANDFGGHDVIEKPAFVPRADKIARSKAFRRMEQALKITDLLLQAGGFGVVAIDMTDLPTEVARRVPMTSWFRFRRAVENTPTALVVLEREASARNCASLVMRLERAKTARTQLSADSPTHAMLLLGLNVEVEIERKSEVAGAKKRPKSVRFDSNCQWSVASGH